MPFKKGESGNPKGPEPGTRAPSNKKIKNAIKSCSIEAVENIALYMRDCRDFIDDCWRKYHSLTMLAGCESDEKLRKDLEIEADTLRREIFSYYGKLAGVSQTLLDYTHKHIINDEKIEKAIAKNDDGDEKPAPARVSLKSVENQ